MTFSVVAMVFNATFNNISVILRQSVLLVEETGGPGKKPTDLEQSRHTMTCTIITYSDLYYRDIQ